MHATILEIKIGRLKSVANSAVPKPMGDDALGRCNIDGTALEETN